MGVDIHTRIEKAGKVLDLQVFNWHSYGMFGFLANVNNWSFVQFLSDRRGLPEGCDWDLGDLYGVTWLSVEELVSFDYDQTFEDRRTIAEISHNLWDGSADAGIGHGNIVTFREFLGEAFFDDLKKLQEAKADRVIMAFDA